MRHLVSYRGDARSRRLAYSLALATALAVAGVVEAAAQSVSPVRRLELSVGGGALGGTHLGEQPADLRAGGTGGPYRLFDSETDFAPSGLLEARVGVALNGRFGVEARGALSRPELRTEVSNDAEGAAGATLVERVDQFMLDGGVLVRLEEWRIAGLTPFATAGAGLVHYLHEADALVDDGRILYAGGGVARVFRERPEGPVRALGLRVDARVNFLSGGDSIGDGARQQGSLSGSVVVAF